MDDAKPELRIPLPRSFALRVLIYYAVGSLVALSLLDTAVNALVMPRWILTVITICVIGGAPAVVAAAWIWTKRR